MALPVERQRSETHICHTIVFVSNLHCSSCVHTIENAVYSLSPLPTLAQVSIVSQSVAVEHSPKLSTDAIRLAIEEAGFDVINEDEKTSPSMGVRSSIAPQFPSLRRNRHLEVCVLCQEEQEHNAALGESSSTRPPADTLDSTSDASRRGEDSCPLLIHMSIGGMTCSSCSGTITRMLSEVEGVSDISISLISKSGSVVIQNRDLLDTVKETIDDCGFEVEVISVEAYNTSSSADGGIVPLETGPRVVSLRVDGMFCP
jgi:P-type Cu+ transporter